MCSPNPNPSETKLPVVLAGFSQGGALSLYQGLQTPSLSGIVCMSGYLPLAKSFAPFVEVNGRVSAPPVRMFHGQIDEVVKHEWGLKTLAALRKLGVHDVQFKTYPLLGHSVDMEELRDVADAITEMIDLDDGGYDDHDARL